VAWADPEFGSIVASCGNDQKVCFYKERSTSEKFGVKQKGHVDTGKVWEKEMIAQLNDPIKDIKFAPRFFGLVIAVALQSGKVKFYKPTSEGDIKMWSDFYGEIQTFTNSCNCVAWNPAFDEDVMIIVGCCQKASKQDKP
jgi:WD40 repeat protein